VKSAFLLYFQPMVRRRMIKLTALFVVAFICLNAGGAMCVAYCQTFNVTAEPEHCPLKKLSNHCDKANESDLSAAASIGTGESDCCTMTVSFLAESWLASTFRDQTSASLKGSRLVLIIAALLHLTGASTASSTGSSRFRAYSA
jgi:hypothetical protein